MDPTKKATIEDINDSFVDLYHKLTSATNRAELGDLSNIARQVFGAQESFGELMILREALGSDYARNT